MLSQYTCGHCGAAFERNVRGLHRQRVRFCSRQCADASRVRAIDERVWDHVNKDGPTPPHVADLGPCWEWAGDRVRHGYGVIRNGSKGAGRTLAHRVTYAVTFGPIPEGLHVLHKCDNPPCVRPDHLFVGTHADNMADARQKKRFAAGDRSPSRLFPERLRRGSRGYWAKLTEEQVAEIKAMYRPYRVSQHTIAKMYGVTRGTIAQIIQGKAWRHVS